MGDLECADPSPQSLCCLDLNRFISKFRVRIGSNLLTLPLLQSGHSNRCGAAFVFFLLRLSPRNLMMKKMTADVPERGLVDSDWALTLSSMCYGSCRS